MDTEKIDSPAGESSVDPEATRDRAPAGCSGSEDIEDAPAWMVLESDVLNGARILLVRDDLYDDEELAERTETTPDNVEARYRMSEALRIADADLDDEKMKKIQTLKKEFGGRALPDDRGGEAVPLSEFVDWL